MIFGHAVPFVSNIFCIVVGLYCVTLVIIFNSMYIWSKYNVLYRVCTINYKDLYVCLSTLVIIMDLQTTGMQSSPYSKVWSKVFFWNVYTKSIIYYIISTSFKCGFVILETSPFWTYHTVLFWCSLMLSVLFYFNYKPIIGVFWYKLKTVCWINLLYT